MAFFRVQTNQLQIPLADLRVPEPASDPPNPDSDGEMVDADVEPKTPVVTRQRSTSNSSEISEDGLPALPEEIMSSGAGRDDDGDREAELTSSAVKGHAISGLLELSRGS
jgi:hypothetical protein